MKPSASYWLEQESFPISNHLKFLYQLQFSRRLPTVCILEFVLDLVKQRCTVHHFELLFSTRTKQGEKKDCRAKIT